MPASVTIAAFVFGAVLILLSIVGGRFKLYGAEIEGTVGKVARTVAFLMGLGFIGMGINRNEAAAPPPQHTTTTETGQQPPVRQQPVQAHAEQPVSGEQQPAPFQNAPVQPAPLPSSQLNLSGIWMDQDGTSYQVTSKGNSFQYASISMPIQPNLRVSGNGAVNGQTVAARYLTNIPSSGSCTGVISLDARQIVGSCSDNLAGQYPWIIARQ